MRGACAALVFAAMASASVACTGADSAATTSGQDGGGGGVDASIDGSVASDADADAFAQRDADAALPDVPPLLFFNLRSGAFPDAGHPDVAVHVPHGFDPFNNPGLVVFFHGFDNCVKNVVASTDGECTPDGGPRDALHLIDQLDAARVNAILVAVELRFDQATGDPGQLAKAGGLHALLHELFVEHMDALLGRALDVADFDPIVVGTHSGGYTAAALAVSIGQVPQIRELDLYDSLYGEMPVFDTWVRSNITRFVAGRPDGLRWMDVYTQAGGTDSNSRAMEANVDVWLADAGLAPSIFDDDTTDTLDGGTLGHPIIFKLTGLPHGDVPKYYFRVFAEHAGFTPL